jgi:hypothetical protein
MDRDEGMGMSQTHGRDVASHLVKELITLAGARPTERVIVVGCEHIEVLIALAQRGFIEVACRTAASGPNAGEAPADLLVAPTVRSEAELLVILSRLNCCLRPGAALLFGTAGSLPAAWRKRLPKLLRQRGFVLVRRHIGSSGLHFLYCRKLPIWQDQAA